MQTHFFAAADLTCQKEESMEMLQKLQTAGRIGASKEALLERADFLANWSEVEI